MASLFRIEKHLGIKIGDMIRCKGKNKEDKNQYYYLEGKYVIIQLLGTLYNKWIIADDSKETFKLLETHIYFYLDNTRDGFAKTHNGIESWGCMRMGYEVKHKNECLYDNLPKLRDNQKRLWQIFSITIFFFKASSLLGLVSSPSGEEPFLDLSIEQGEGDKVHKRLDQPITPFQVPDPQQGQRMKAYCYRH
jgi:hypothetical protein